MGDAPTSRAALPELSPDSQPGTSPDTTRVLTEERHRLGRIVRRLTYVLTIIVMLTLPFVYFIVVYGKENASAELDVRRMGLDLAQFITFHGELWVFQGHRLEEIFHKQERLVGADKNVENYSIQGPEGKIIASTDRILLWPVTAYEWPVKDGIKTLGEITLYKSHQEQVIETAIVATFGIGLAVFIYLTVLRLPARMLDSAFDQLAESEEALRENRNLLDSIIENVPVALLIKDPDHVVERANSTYLNWYGFDADTMLNRRSDEIAGFQSGEEVETMNAQEREVLTTGKTLVRQVERSFADGQIHTVNITKFPVYDQQGNITKVGSVGFDLTEQVQANRVKSEFLASMSHDLRTPLNAIIGFSDFIILQYFGPVGDKYQEYAKDIKSSGKLLLSLINDILDLSAIEAGKRSIAKENISITDVVTECGTIIKNRAQSLGVDLVMKVSKNLPPLYADRLAITKILLNLLSNSVKFTPKGGKVTLRATATNEHHTIEISDTGMGIPDDKIATIADPFVRGEADPHKSQQGSGLGLSIVKSLVDLHNGELEIKSTVGKGTTITVTLPNTA